MDSVSDRHKSGRNSSFRKGRHETYGFENMTSSPLGSVYTQREVAADLGVNSAVEKLASVLRAIWLSHEQNNANGMTDR